MQNDERWHEADAWLDQALDLPPGERKAFLAGCPDPALRHTVERLLELAERTGDELVPGAMLEKWAVPELELGETPRMAGIPKLGHLLAGRYQLEERVGEGGMGVVFRARDTKLDRKVAVKMITRDGIDASGRARLLQEARAAAALNHPNIASLHDVGEEDGRPFLVMELVEGRTLESSPPQTPLEIVTTTRQIAAALEHAHARGIVHRDLKPTNVLIAETESGPVVKLVDLGVALGRDPSRLTAEGHILGTPSYMAPEQALGRNVDGRTDLYALGVMMYSWTTGRLPFSGDDALAVVAKHIHASLEPPRSFRPDVPEALDEIITRLLAKDPDERFSSATSLMEALVSAVESPREGVAAPTDWERICRRLIGTSRPVPMQGREPAKRLLSESLRRLLGADDAGGAGSVLLISGEPGTGKSRFVVDLVRAAGEAGAFVLAGAAHELSAGLPYAPFVEAWEEHLKGTGALASTNPFTAFAPTRERMQESTLRLFQEVESALFHASRGGPAVLIIEDLHWADESSLQLFDELHRRVATRPLLLVGTYVEGEAPSRGKLASLLSNLRRRRHAQWLRLPALSPQETSAQIEALTGSLPDSSYVQRIHELSGGNPLFTEELVLDALERGADDGSLDIPRSLAEVVQERVSRLGRDAESLLRVASVSGTSFCFEWIREASALGESRSFDALEASLEAGLLAEEEERDGWYRFRHALVREAIQGELSRERRKALHNAVAEALLGRELERESIGRDAMLAYHLQSAGRSAEALPHLIAAGRIAMSRVGFQEAKSAFQSALAILDAEGERTGARRFQVMSSLGSIDFALSNLQEALTYFESAASLEPAEDGWKLEPEPRARVLLGAAQSCITSGNLPRADQLLAEMLSSLPTGSRLLGAGLYHLAQLRWTEGKYGDAYETAKRALREAEAIDDRDGLAKGYEMLALACHSLGEWREGIECVARRKEIVGDAVEVAEAFDAHL